MFGVGMSELLMILVVALIVLGPQKLPEIAKALGKGFAEFRRASQGLRDALDTQAEKSGFTGAFREVRDAVTGAADAAPPGPPQSVAAEPAPAAASPAETAASGPSAAPVEAGEPAGTGAAASPPEDTRPA